MKRHKEIKPRDIRTTLYRFHQYCNNFRENNENASIHDKQQLHQSKSDTCNVIRMMCLLYIQTDVYSISTKNTLPCTQSPHTHTHIRSQSSVGRSLKLTLLDNNGVDLLLMGLLLRLDTEDIMSGLYTNTHIGQDIIYSQQ